ncbi:MAG: adenylyltransferase/cytidyltransferase family protein [bacterium]|nr:adenylyltransferase/cytidyltransferase family protein [bacterium]
MNTKIISYSEIGKLKQLSGNKVLVGGCFDLLHYGHLVFLKNSKKLGDHLIIALESDEFISKNKRMSSIHTQNQRAEILASLMFVNYVVLLPFMKDYQDYFNMVENIHPQIVAVTKGDDQREKKQEQIKKIGGKLSVVTAYISNFSTKQIIARFSE